MNKFWSNPWCLTYGTYEGSTSHCMYVHTYVEN